MRAGLFFILMMFVALAEGEQVPYLENNLSWPLTPRNTKEVMGPLLHQYQKFPGSAAYFHEGVDLLALPFQSVYAPVSGRVDGGYYSYVTDDQGYSMKTYLPLSQIPEDDEEPKLWGERYFEISITDDLGYRFEFHHIDRKSLPSSILESLKSGGGFVAEGVELGKVIPWPQKVLGKDYSHIHYSIISPEGFQLNPMWFSERIRDEKAPVISAVYFQLAEPCPESGRAEHLLVSKLEKGDHAMALILKVKDHLGENHFPQAPTKVAAFFSNGDAYSFDFSYSIETWTERPSLSDLYLNFLCLGNRDETFVLKASKNFDFYIKVPLPEAFFGSVEIFVSDYAGNQSQKRVEVF